MTDRKDHTMNTKKFITTLILIATAMQITGCACSAPTTPVVPTTAPVATETPVPTKAVQATETPTLAPTATNTPVPTATSTPEPTATKAPTDTPVPTATSTPVPTATSTPTPEPTATNTPVPTATNTPVPTATNTPVPTATNTPKPTATSTPKPTNTPKPTATNTPVPTATNVPEPNVTLTGDQLKQRAIEIAKAHEADRALYLQRLKDAGATEDTTILSIPLENEYIFSISEEDFRVLFDYINGHLKTPEEFVEAATLVGVIPNGDYGHYTVRDEWTPLYGVPGDKHGHTEYGVTYNGMLFGHTICVGYNCSDDTYSDLVFDRAVWF